MITIFTPSLVKILFVLFENGNYEEIEIIPILCSSGEKHIFWQQ